MTPAPMLPPRPSQIPSAATLMPSEVSSPPTSPPNSPPTSPRSTTLASSPPRRMKKDSISSISEAELPPRLPPRKIPDLTTPLPLSESVVSKHYYSCKFCGRKIYHKNANTFSILITLLVLCSCKCEGLKSIIKTLKNKAFTSKISFIASINFKVLHETPHLEAKTFKLLFKHFSLQTHFYFIFRPFLVFFKKRSVYFYN